MLKDENLHQSVKIFEEYCNSGLSIIQKWFDDNPGDIEGIDTLVNKIYGHIAEMNQESTSILGRGEVSF